MKVSVVGEVVHGPSMAQVHVIDNADVGKSIEGPVDGRLVDGRVMLGDL